ncbi:MAG: argininosuccinate synthase domain-containing protein [Campylobacterota bacterium]
MKALALFSGGLDSTLAAKTIARQGIEVIALHVDIGFGGMGDKKAHLQKMAAAADARLEIVDAQKAFLDEVLFAPKYGYGKNFNPCIDCHGFMFALAKELMDAYDAKFLISGEVMGQRPMSQNKGAMRSVLNISDTDDLLLRPLSAKLMEPTLAERQGWVRREELLDFSGRGRSRQLALAREYGIGEYESPAGGCLLTDVGFSNRLREFIKYNSLQTQDIDLLKAGRHMRLPGGAKLVVGRDKEDNEKLEAIQNDTYRPVTQNVVGPFSLLQKDAGEADRELAARIVATYAKNEGKTVTVFIGDNRYQVQPFAAKEEVHPYLVQ